MGLCPLLVAGAPEVGEELIVASSAGEAHELAEVLPRRGSCTRADAAGCADAAVPCPGRHRRMAGRGCCPLCPSCYRPVFESSSSRALIGAGPTPVIGLCRLCAERTTLRTLRQMDVPVAPQQRAVLETVAAAMA